MGNLIFNSGYNTYSNPYYSTNTVVYQALPASTTTVVAAPPVDYSEPLAVAAEVSSQAIEKLPEEEQASLADKALEALDAGRTAFKARDYLTALKKAEEAISYDPGDPVLHEFRALGLFALGKFSDAAIVLNAVLASGPGWGWSTMIEMYDSPKTYESQLRTLEDYAKGSPKAADAQFVLGYHYLTAGHLAEATEAFGKVVQLQPADDIAKQLYDLCKNSSDGDDETEAPPADEQPAPETEVTLPDPTMEQLAGTWVADRGDKGTITLTIKEDNTFTWSFKQGDKPSSDMKGEVSINEGLLVLGADQSQMVGGTEFSDDDKKMNFVLAGGPPDDKGLDFVKKG